MAAVYDGVAVCATDLPCVLPLLRRNAERASAGGAVRGQLRVAPLPWGCPPDALRGRELSPDIVLGCELFYFAFSLLAEDTRRPLRATLCTLCAAPGARALLAFTLRDADRELGLLDALLREDGFECR